MGENPKFERPTTLEEEHELTLERSKYLLDQLGEDRLTGLKNRTFFENELERALKAISMAGEDHRRSGGEPLKELSILFIDLDDFKRVNDTRGHLAGDEVLKNVVNILIDSVREADVVARFGGDEFYVLLPRADEEAAKTIANKILTNLKNDPEIIEFNISASIGISSSHISTDSKVLIHLADQAAKKAKQNGKNQAVVSNEGIVP